MIVMAEYRHRKSSNFHFYPIVVSNQQDIIAGSNRASIGQWESADEVRCVGSGLVLVAEEGSVVSSCFAADAPAATVIKKSISEVNQRKQCLHEAKNGHYHHRSHNSHK